MNTRLTIAALIYNPTSGSALTTQQLTDLFLSHDITIGTFIALSDRLEDDLKPHLAKDALIAAIGGDGTLSTVAGILTGSPAIMLPLPGGTLNHFTKDLGVPQDLHDAIARLRTGEPFAIDVASVNNTVFINNSSLGLYPSSLQAREKLEGTLGKWPSAVIGVLRALITFRSYSLVIDGASVRTPFVFVGNNDYHLDTLEGRRTSLSSGKLSVYVVSSGSRFGLLKLLPFALIGKLREHDSFNTYHTTTLTVSGRRQSMYVSHDGEFSRFNLPLTYAIRPKSLRVIGSL